MVHALEKIQRLLKPGGMLIDIHPTPEPAALEVRVGRHTTPAGWLNETDDYEDYEHADRAIAAAVGNGLFRIERESTFEFVWYADSLAQLREYLAEEWENATIDELTAGRIEELLSTPEPDKEVIVREPIRIARLKPLNKA
ncbi:MAG TPA: hypothetical protein VJG32_06750 [Anaerolineae bacterium]|nr:hypothetical protein [Anaerolineae bacterium]